MKKLLSLLLSTSLLALCFFAPVVTIGCKTANRTAYKATGAVVVTVDTAMRAWGDYVASNHPPVAQENAVKDAFLKYQAAASAVAAAGAAHARILAAPPRPDGDTSGATGALATLNGAIAISSAALGDLITLVQRFGAKI